MTTSKQNKTITIALLAAVSFTMIANLKANAAIITVNDSGSWINGADTLANQGFDLISIPNGTEAFETDLSTLSSPLGDIGFSPSVKKQQIGTTWLTWSNGYQGEVYFTNTALTLDLKLPNLAAFDFYAEPNLQNPFTISAIAQSGEVSDVLSQVVNGNAGAKYFGFYSDDPLDPIQSIRITADPDSRGFAIAQMRGATATVPTPLLLPGIIGLGLSLWRKARSRSQHSEN
ncbi:MAG: PTPA-CTERM sorting domain-containing protein [Plectolyngbya sp. WJT66-NPBG17]|jgi:hypothetical protein|nr:PTPA-CTERM sorting domain-containing protein [Plectolyngbya sp. WJT66-NPBG17]MBW4523685.1 PTPA-CTERM sorting domain-containing protein [Phormidium tanganyikae FI6-MK23]